MRMSYLTSLNPRLLKNIACVRVDSVPFLHSSIKLFDSAFHKSLLELNQGMTVVSQLIKD